METKKCMQYQDRGVLYTRINVNTEFVSFWNVLEWKNVSKMQVKVEFCRKLFKFSDEFNFQDSFAEM